MLIDSKPFSLGHFVSITTVTGFYVKYRKQTIQNSLADLSRSSIDTEIITQCLTATHNYYIIMNYFGKSLVKYVFGYHVCYNEIDPGWTYKFKNLPDRLGGQEPSQVVS